MKSNLPPFVRPYYQEPLIIQNGSGANLCDTSGVTYLDAYCGVATAILGHRAAIVDNAAVEQIRKFGHISHIYINPSEISYSEHLLSHVGDNLDKVFFVNSGSEAVDLALCLAKGFSRGGDIIALKDSYHGGSYLSKCVTGLSNWSFPDCEIPGIHHCMTPKCHGCTHSSTCKVDSEAPCIQELVNTVRSSNPECIREKSIPIVIIEPVLGVGGVIIPPPAYFNALNELQAAGEIILIADEVQTGFGRCGCQGSDSDNMILFGSQLFGLKPDIIALGKGIANGYPLGAVAMSSEIADSGREILHFNTFGGHPVSIAAAMATLSELIADKIPRRVHHAGKILMESLHDSMKSPLDDNFFDLRGTGFFIGLETPSRTHALAIMEKTRKKGLLLGLGGISGNTIRIEPPLIFSVDQCLCAAEILSAAVSEVI
jgi:4-aminobutyrate aminotransferase-like enzyme